MSLVALLSHKGAPGVTSLAVELCRHWPDGDVVLAELDPFGGDIARRMGLAERPGLSTLATALRPGLAPEVILGHAQRLDRFRVLVGLRDEREAARLADRVPALVAGLAELPATVVCDLGRRTTDSALQAEVLRACGLCLLVTAGDQAALLGARGLARRLDPDRSLLVCTGDTPYPAAEVEAAVGLGVAAILPDPGLASGSRKGARAMQSLAREVSARICPPLADPMRTTTSWEIEGLNEPNDAATDPRLPISRRAATRCR